ncbi:YbaN family protein [Aquincola sp. MAHUQ-54]|uniref:YbaN family protein n=1 Tax=Aquincola agrisoli TaxID=3119538 RepID=A0AAW9Q7C8_9BURK
MPVPLDERPHWQRVLWLAAGGLSLVLGLVGLLLPLLPTVPFVLLAAFCFSRGSERCERWIVEHRHFGPMVRDWRANRAVPLRAKWLATVMMSISSVGAWFLLPPPWAWIPAGCCTLVAAWLWSLPTASVRPAAER